MFKVLLIILCFCSSNLFARESKEVKDKRRQAFWGLLSDLNMLIVRCETEVSCKIFAEDSVGEMKDRFELVKINLDGKSLVLKNWDLVLASIKNPTHSNVDLLSSMDDFIKVLVAAAPTTIGPVGTPDFEDGKTVFEKHCASCHGLQNSSQKSIADQLRIKPRSLDESWRENRHSPLLVYSSVVAGVSGSEMPAFREIIDDAHIWNLSFYVATLLRTTLENQTCDVSIDLRTIIVSSNQELSKLFKSDAACKDPVSYVRNNLTFKTGTLRSIMESEENKESKIIGSIVLAAVALTMLGYLYFKSRQQGADS